QSGQIIRPATVLRSLDYGRARRTSRNHRAERFGQEYLAEGTLGRRAAQLGLRAAWPGGNRRLLRSKAPGSAAGRDGAEGSLAARGSQRHGVYGTLVTGSIRAPR